MQTIAISNQKGGVGKSATAHALGAVLAGSRRVLLVDTDPQSSLTMACGVKDAGGRSLAEVIGGAAPGTLAIGDIVVELGERLHLAPADIALAGAELGLTSRLGRENVLRRSLVTVAGRYDVCVIDCPPSLGLLTVGALVASDGVLIPTIPQAADLRGLAMFLDTLATVKRELNQALDTIGIVATFFDGRLIHHQDAIEAMQSGDLPLLPVTIGRSVRVAEAMAAGEPVTTYDPGNKQAAAYQELGRIVESWLKEQK
jgi:chromosome partitioning protein